MQPDRVSPELPPAGWYDDPEGAGLRWWNGQQWTAHRRLEEQLPPLPITGIQPRATRNPTPMDAWNGLMAGGRWIIVAILLFALVSLSVTLVATLGGASAASAQKIAAKVIVYGALALLGIRFFASR
jgi:hypothetical protein